MRIRTGHGRLDWDSVGPGAAVVAHRHQGGVVPGAQADRPARKLWGPKPLEECKRGHSDWRMRADGTHRYCRVCDCDRARESKRRTRARRKAALA